MIFWLFTLILLHSEDELIHDGHRKGISDVVAVHPIPGLDWFVTSFDRGFGNRFYYRGKVTFNIIKT